MTKTNFEPSFDPCYVQGYTAALLDVNEILEHIGPDLKRHKRKQDGKTYQAIIKCVIENRTVLRECPDAFVRCNDSVPGGFEIWRESYSKT